MIAVQWPILRHELVKCLTGKWFALSTALAVLLAVGSAVESCRYVMSVLVPFGRFSTNMSAFSNWIVPNCNASLFSSIFFYVAPLLMCIPSATQLLTERRSGYEMQLALRAEARARMIARAIVAFLSAALIMTVALLSNLVVLCCVLPAATPIVEEWFILGIFYDCLFSELFYTHPVAYVIAFTALDALIAGVWSMFVFSLTRVLRSRALLLTIPYFLLLVWQYVTKELVTTFHVIGFSVNIIDDMQGTFYVAKSDWLSVAAQLTLLLAIAAMLVRGLAREEVL